jgi:Tfp pilus assembly protein PilN
MVGLTLKYRVNLYREREERAIRFRQGLVRGVLMGTVVGVEVLLVGVLVVTGANMHRQGEQLRHSVSVLQTQAREKPDEAGLAELRTLIRARLDRVDWATLLTRVADAVPPQLVLTEIRGGMGGQRGRMDGIELEGHQVGSGADLAPVLSFIETLKADSLLAQSYPVVDLGTAKGQGNTFQIVCRRAKPGSAP